MKNIKVAKNLPNRCPTAMDVLDLIMLHIDRNLDKKFQPSIFLKSGGNHIPKTFYQTDLYFKL